MYCVFHGSMCGSGAQRSDQWVQRYQGRKLAQSVYPLHPEGIGAAFLSGKISGGHPVFVAFLDNKMACSTYGQQVEPQLRPELGSLGYRT